MNIKIIENFISEDQCKKIIKNVIKEKKWDKKNDKFLDDRVFATRSSKNIIFKQEMTLVLNKIRINILEHYKVSELWNDGFMVVKWFPGMSHDPHADNMIESWGNDEKNVFRYREFGAVLYLNDNFNGGETYYPQHNFFVKPKTGTLIIHPADNNHIHGVSEIKDKTRYTLASFWTTNKKYSEEDEFASRG